MEYKPEMVVVLITASSQDEALKIANGLVESHVAACANVIHDVRSVFRWDGKISSEPECLIIAKTTMQAYPSLEKKVKESHSYSVPEIIALPVVAGSKEYLEWVRKESHN